MLPKELGIYAKVVLVPTTTDSFRLQRSWRFTDKFDDRLNVMLAWVVRASLIQVP